MVRIKHRYLLIHILYPDPADPKTTGHPPSSLQNPPPDLIHFHRPSPPDLTPQVLARAIRQQVQSLYGDYGLGLVAGGLNVKYLSPATSTAIVRCARAHYRLVWAALSFTTELTGAKTACAMQVVRVSGTIRKVEEEAIRRARGAILRAKRESGGESADGVLRVLGEGDEGGGRDGRPGSDVDDEDEEDQVMGMESDEGG